MAPAPAAGKAQGTPTKLVRKNPSGSTPRKIGQPSSAKQPSTPKAASATKPETDSPSLPPRPEAEEVQSKAEDTAEEASAPAGEAAEQAQGATDADDNDEPLSKVTPAADEAEEGLEEAAPEPVQDDEEDETTGGAVEQAQEAAEDAGDEAEDVADDATEKAGQMGESADDTTDEQEQQGGLLKDAQGLAGKASGLAGKAKEDPSSAAKEAAGDAKEEVEETAEDAEETAEDAVDETQKVAGETTDEAGDAAEDGVDGVEDEDGEAVEGVEDEAGEAVDGVEDEAADGVEDEAGEADEAVEAAQETAEDAQETAEDAQETAEDAQDTAEDAQETAEAAVDEAGETADGADGVDGVKEAVEGETGEDAEETDGLADGVPEGLPLDLSVLKGLEVQEDGTVVDAEGNAIGKLAEGDAEDLAGYPIGDDGEILDDDGDLVGRVELLPETIKKQLAQAKEDGVELPEEAEQYLGTLDEEAGEEGEEEVEEAGPALPALSILQGLTCQIDGLIYDAEGNTVGVVTDGDPEQLQNAVLNENGEFIDEEGNVIGHAEIHDDAAALVEEGVYEADPEAVAAAQDAAKDAEGAADDAAENADAAEDAQDAAEDAQDAAEDAQEGAEDAAEDAQAAVDENGEILEGIEDQLPGIEALQGKEFNEVGDIVDEEGNVLGGIEDETIRQKIADGEIDPNTLKIDEEGQIVDEEGNVLGKTELAEGAAEKLAEGGPLLDPRILEGKKVNKKGKILNDDGEEIGELLDGDLKACAGKKVNDKLEILDKNGNVVGHVKVIPGEAAEDATRELLEELGEIEPEEEAEEEAQEVQEEVSRDLGLLEGLKVNKQGQILNEDGEPIGELVEGDLEVCAGKKVNDKGEVLDDMGNVVGRVQTLNAEPAEDVVEEEEGPQLPPLSVLEGLTCNKSGKIVDDNGTIVGELVEGDAKKLAKSGITADAEGQFWDNKGHVIGRAVTVAIEDPDEESPFAGLEGLHVVEDGFVEDVLGNKVGIVVEGDPKKLIGREVDEDGDIIDKKGSVVGHAERYEEPEPEVEEEGPVLPPLSILEGLKCNKVGKLVDANGTIVGELIEGDPKKLAKSGITCDAEGQFWDTKGHVIGRAQTVMVEDGESQEATFAGLEGLHVVEDGFVQDSLGNNVGYVTEGDPKKLIGRDVDEDGDILDSKGNIVGHAERYEEEEVVEEIPEEVDLSFLQGKTLTKAGLIIGDNGVPIARLVEGNAAELAGKAVDDQGQIWNDSGKVIGRIELIPENEREARAEGPFAGLEGLRVIEAGQVADEDGNVVGEIVEGNPKRLIGMAVDEDGDILDKYGNVKGHAERLPEVEDAVVDNSILNGKMLNKQGYVVDEEGVPFGRLVEGNAAELAGRRCDENGYLYNDMGKMVGRCEIIPENERIHRPEGPFAGLEGLRVVKDAKVEDEDGNVVGEVVEGNPKRLIGMAVDEDGDILDKFGNVKGHAERWEEEEQTAADLSALAGCTINKHGNAVDGNGQIIGRLVEGDPQTMIGKKVDGQGQVWDNAGNVVGRCELALGQDTTEEGPFAGFEGLVINKDETVTTPAGDIVGRIIEGDIKKLLGHTVDEDGDVLDKNGNRIGRAERWEPEEKERRINPMSGMRVNKEGEVRDENGDLVGRLTMGDLGHCVGQEIDDNGNVVDVDGNKIGECTLLENIADDFVGPTEEELAAAAAAEEDREIAEKMATICTQTLERMQPICKQINEHMEKADRTPKDELDEEELVNNVKPLIEEGGRILQECNGSLRGLDPDGRIAAQAKGRAGTKEATPEEYRLAETLKELTSTVVTTIDNAKKKLNDMPYAKKKLNPLWGLMTQPLFQILAAVGLLLAGVLGLVGQLLNGLGLGGLVNGILGGLGINKLLAGFGLIDDKKKKGGKGKSALASLPLVGGMLGGGK